MNIILKFVLGILLLLLAGYLFLDSITFALYPRDPISGRERGCYTELELVFGARKPTEWVRWVELSGVGVLLISGIAVLVKSPRSR